MREINLVEAELLQLKAGVPTKGYIVYTTNGSFDVCSPLRLAQFADRRVDEFADFNAACDQYYSRAEAQRVEAQRTAQVAVNDLYAKVFSVSNSHWTFAIARFRALRSDWNTFAQIMQRDLLVVDDENVDC